MADVLCSQSHLDSAWVLSWSGIGSAAVSDFLVYAWVLFSDHVGGLRWGLCCALDGCLLRLSVVTSLGSARSTYTGHLGVFQGPLCWLGRRYAGDL